MKRENWAISIISSVGGGSSGATLAGRLSSNPSVKVLLLEAGPSDGSLKIKVPLGYGSLFYDQKFNWKYETEPEAELNGRRMYWPRGKVLGGSSAINAMVYVRGHQNDFKDWAKVAPSWSWSNVEPLFKKIEAWKGEIPQLGVLVQLAFQMLNVMFIH
ncbi:MAG: hypothetical protein CM15mP85_24030 [Rhodobacterales bacterium]|nr:MAG: hypothetical protein CM15mP85_24030 [Rhodobacterales bacterium]